MARTPKSALSLLLVCSFILGAMVSLCSSCPTSCETEIVWTLYARQIGKGDNRNQEQAVPPVNNITKFGEIVVNNWAVLDAPVPTANIVAHARGTHMMAGDWFTSLSIVFEGARYFFLYVVCNKLPTFLVLNSSHGMRLTCS
jgi:hypothetical protein